MAGNLIDFKTHAEKFREKVSVLKDVRMKVEADQDVAYATGFLSFDFMNGQVVVQERPDGEKVKYNSVGIMEGSITMVIGRSGCGKTTWIMQSAAQIIKPFRTSCIFHDDIEGGISNGRKMVLTGMEGEEFERRYLPRNAGINAENFYQRIQMIHDMKIGEDYESTLYDTGLIGKDGKPLYKLEPTVYILDSLAMLMPEKFTEEEEISGQMSATATAKMNAGVFKRITPMLKAANIILFVVNHINDKVEINPFSHTASQVSYLKQGETVPGGRAPLYLSNLLIRLDDSTKLKETEGFKIKGSIVTFTVLKSRTATASSAVDLVFDYSKGFDPDLSMFLYLKNNGYVKGAGVGLYFGDRNDLKFSQATFKDKLYSNEEFRSVYFDVAATALTELIERNTPPVNHTENASSMILNRMSVITPAAA